MKSKHSAGVYLLSVTSGRIVCYPITATSIFWMCHTICYNLLSPSPLGRPDTQANKSRFLWETDLVAILTLVLLVRQTVRAMRGLLDNLHTVIHLYTNVTVLMLANIHPLNIPDVFFGFRILLPYWLKITDQVRFYNSSGWHVFWIVLLCHSNKWDFKVCFSVPL